ncbi:MAG: penicillin-binding protein 2 [Candidatus Cloacimonetes bacterium HGW-Cloacimonetes-1]|jgi:penicillin-binding protein 2|nr:MAG: penicillin-binding protein 2 [Candidatus Cloacimonetes bacterium HGW-Cloacimonetes-1]
MNKISPILVFRIVLALLFLLLSAALFRLQVMNGTYYKQIAESNFVRIRRITATRGEIYDHKYRPIVTNVASHNLYLISGKVNNLPALADFLKLNFGLERADLEQMIRQNRFRTYEEILISDNIPYEEVLALSEQMNYYPELAFRVGTTRNYQYPNHFTGYVGRINEKEYARYHDEDYSINAHIGKTGLEYFYEVLLRGKDGREIVQVDSRGRSLNLFRNDGSITPVNGLGLVLTIDNDLQEFVNQSFPANMRGAVVVMDVKTGGILSYISKPGYDPNVFMQQISPEIWSELNNSAKPMLDRVIHAAYPPGSVFKPITGSLGLERKLIDRFTILSNCAGGMQVGNRFFKCWNHAGHGRTNLIEALKGSCDVFFYDLSLKLSLDDFHDYAQQNMVCVKTGIDLPNERRGFFPTTDWYRKTLGKKFAIIGRKVNLSIGQGEVLTTPLQICAYFSALANDGMWIQPHLLESTVGINRLTRDQVHPITKKRLPMSASTLKAIQDGLYAVCNLPGGTGAHVKVAGATIYGKTGSAENAMGRTTHAWFSAYMVTQKPDIAVTVFLENAGGGGGVAGPIAGRILNYYAGNIDKITRPVPIPPQFMSSDNTDTEVENPDANPAEKPTPEVGND